MKYVSTRDTSKTFEFKDVFIKGLADDGGLFIPKSLKKFSSNEINDLITLDYSALAKKIIYPFIGNFMSENDLSKIIDKSYSVFRKDNVIEMIKLGDRSILELFHGPTLAFKDVAMQLLGTLLNYFAQKEKTKIAVLGATSGDTGSAAISACSRYENVEIFILYPHERVTEIQRKQMTTTEAKNVHALSVETDFDGCQTIIKKLFLDESIVSNETRFIAANSINWARCMTQSVYYFWTYLRLKEQLNGLIFSIPSGNFGHAYAGWLAKEMGLPIDKILIATNSNDVLHKLFSENSYKKGQVTETLAPSMDISVASNFERLLFNLFNNDSEKLKKTMSVFPKEQITVPRDYWKKAEDLFLSFPSTDQEILHEIKNTFEKNNYIVDPHTSTGVRAATELVSPDQSVVTMATAHPSKFMGAIKQVLAEDAVETPSQLKDIEDKQEDFVVLPNNMDKVREYIVSSIN